MTNNKKIIWSVYLVLWVYFIFFDSSYSQSDHIGTYLIFGWLPFLLLHFLWKQQPNLAKNTTATQQSDNEPFERKYALLCQVMDKDLIQKFVTLLNACEKDDVQLKQEELSMANTMGTTPEKLLNLPYEELMKHDMGIYQKYLDLNDRIMENNHYLGYAQVVIDVANEINTKLLAGMSVEDAKVISNKKLADIQNTETEARVKLDASKGMTKLLLKAKQEGWKTIPKTEIDAMLSNLSKKYEAETKS